MLNSRTVIELLERGDESGVALAAPERESLSFGELRSHVMTTVAAMNKLGVGRNDPVEIIVGNRGCGRNVLIARKAHFLLRVGCRFPPVKPVGLVHRVFGFAGKLVHQSSVGFGGQLPPAER